jgi:hypothetical protein
VARIVGVDTFCAGDVALVRVRTEDGHQGVRSVLVLD